jgi:hypothetical protein
VKLSGPGLAALLKQHERCVRELDDRLYDWPTTVSALSR